MTEQFKVAVPYNERVPGWLYDVHSGICMGIASDEMKKERSANVPFNERRGNGCMHTLVIHPFIPGQ